MKIGSRRINVQKIASLKELFNKPVSEIIFNIKSVLMILIKFHLYLRKDEGQY